MKYVELCSDDSVELCWDTSSVEEEDSNMDRPVEVEISVEEEIKSDVVGQYGFKSYFLQLMDLKWYHYPTDRIYSLMRDKLNLPLIWRLRTDSDFENADMAPLREAGYHLHFASGKVVDCGNARVDRYHGVDAVIA